MVLPIDAQLAGLSLGSASQHAGGHWSMRWLHEVGIALGSGDGTGEGRSVGSEDGSIDGEPDGSADGTGDGSGVGLQSIRSCGSKHLSGQHAQLMPVGKGNVLQIAFPTEAQLAGRSLGSISQHDTGHKSIKWLQAVGASDGEVVGPTEASSDGDDDGDGDGNIVGEQTGGSPFGCVSNIG